GEEFKLGGFSGMVPAFTHGQNRYFHLLSDRGPNLDIFEYVRIDENGNRVYLDAQGNETTDIAQSPVAAKGFAAPHFGPAILLVKVPRNGQAKIQKVTPLRKPNGEIVSGLPNFYVDPLADPPVTEEGPVLDVAGSPLDLDPDGLDTEGLALSPGGIFWVSEEYSSICAVHPNGTVMLRLVPKGYGPGEDIPTIDPLPAVFRKRIPNRGLEGITFLSSRVILSSFQRPLANPDRAASEASSNIRLVRIDLVKLFAGDSGAIRQFIYRTDGAANRSTYISDLFALSSSDFLASERRTNKVFRVSLEGATDVTSLEDESGLLLEPVEYDYETSTGTVHVKRTTIEQLLLVGPDGVTNELSLAGITPVSKRTVLDLAGIVAQDANNGKFEGLCVLRGEIFIVPDNDFDLVNGVRLKAEPGAPL
ncbi:MAG TPA: esterase-like activity of phytase family protein, partial [Candidatus Eisenbacteria bacterium]|nr:esterase-like activity of phytase family protein [Candidatus Eisenbacteria bacterium]